MDKPPLGCIHKMVLHSNGKEGTITHTATRMILKCNILHLHLNLKPDSKATQCIYDSTHTTLCRRQNYSSREQTTDGQALELGKDLTSKVRL